MQLKINHTTRYHYAVPPAYALLQMRMRAQSSAVQTVREWQMDLQGASLQTAFVDQHQNLVDLIALNPGERDIEISVSGIVDTKPTQGIKGPHDATMPLWFYRRASDLTRAGSGVAAVLAELGDIAVDPLGGLHQLSALIREKVAYTVGATQTTTTAEDALRLSQGVCQDHSHIFVSAARALAIPARYVSGYLMMNDRIDQQASHAWAEAFIEGLGWVGFDISNGISPDERYVHLCYGLDYTEAAPTFGIIRGAQEEALSVSIQVQQ